MEIIESDLPEEVGQVFDDYSDITATETSVAFNGGGLTGDSGFVASRDGNKISYILTQGDQASNKFVFTLEGTFTSPASFSGTTTYTDNLSSGEVINSTGKLTMTKHYELDGVWDYTAKTIKSDLEDVDAGDTLSGEFVVITARGIVEFKDKSEKLAIEEIVAARNGNEISSSYTEEDTDASTFQEFAFEGNFTSPTSFSGTITYTETLNGKTNNMMQEVTMTKQ